MKKLTILALAGVNGPDFPEQDGIVRDHTLHAHLTHSRAPLRHTPWGPLRLRNGPRKLDSAVSEILHGFQAAKLRLAWSKYTASGVRRSSAL